MRTETPSVIVIIREPVEVHVKHHEQFHLVISLNRNFALRHVKFVIQDHYNKLSSFTNSTYLSCYGKQTVELLSIY